MLYPSAGIVRSVYRVKCSGSLIKENQGNVDSHAKSNRSLPMSNRDQKQAT